MRGKNGWNVPYEGSHPTLKRFFKLTDEMKMTYTEIAYRLGAKPDSIRRRKIGLATPRMPTLKRMEEFIKEHETESQIEIPGYTLTSITPRKNKNDMPMYTYKRTTPQERAADNIGISEDELIDYAIKGMPEDVRTSLLREMLKKGKGR